mgnify:CR=1 FL=1
MKRITYFEFPLFPPLVASHGLHELQLLLLPPKTLGDFQMPFVVLSLMSELAELVQLLGKIP